MWENMFGTFSKHQTGANLRTGWAKIVASPPRGRLGQNVTAPEFPENGEK